MSNEMAEDLVHLTQPPLYPPVLTTNRLSPFLLSLTLGYRNKNFLQKRKFWDANQIDLLSQRIIT